MVQLIGVSCAYRNGLQLGKSMGVKMGEVPKLKDFAFFRLRDLLLQTPQGLVPLGFGKLTKKCAMGRFEFAQAIA